MNKSFKQLSEMPGTILKGDSAITPYLRDTMVEGDPDIVLRPRDVSDLKEILKLCGTDKIPATVCGARTSMSGSAAALSGAVISTEKICNFLEIEDNDSIITATAQTGMPLIDFKKKLEENGYFYPSHPTSVKDAFLGATVATNATGDDSFKYGPTRRWVRKMKVLLIDGTEREFVRPKESRPKEIKSKGGYYLNGPEIDRFIGSEGTLGIITEVTLDILKGVPEFYSIMVPFASNEDAIAFIHRHATRPSTCSGRTVSNPFTLSQSKGENLLDLRSLEFIDEVGVEIMRKHEGFPDLPENAKALVYSNTEFNPGKFEESVGLWLEELSNFGLEENLIDRTIVAVDRKEKEDMHSWRHFIPEWINETYRKYEEQGGGKVGSDWWVPLEHISEMMKWFYQASHESDIPFIAYAHIGNGHPHTNYFTRNSSEREKATSLVIEACKKAVAYGGGVAGEHGIGKIKRHLLPIQYPQEIIQKMRSLKTHYDPNWLLGQGNIFQTGC